MTLNSAEEQFVKGLFAEMVKQKQIEILNKEMWEKVEAAKPDWVKVVEIKREYSEKTKHI